VHGFLGILRKKLASNVRGDYPPIYKAENVEAVGENVFRQWRIVYFEAGVAEWLSR
jgi:hypothetical protein